MACKSDYEKLLQKAGEDCQCNDLTPQQEAEGYRCDVCKAAGILNTCAEIMYEEVREQEL